MATKIQILGTGCAKCTDLAKNAEAAAKAAGIAYELEKVSDVQKIMQFGVMMTPGLVVDGKVVASGKVLSPAEIAPFLKLAAGGGNSGCSSGCCCDPAANAKSATPSACDCDCTSKGGSQPCSCDSATGPGAGGGGCCSSGGGRRSILRLWLFPLIALAVGGVLWLKQGKNAETPKPAPPATSDAPTTGGVRTAETPKSLPKLMDFGSIGCKPCKIMDGVLEELKKGYPGRLQVEFVNVKQMPELAEVCKIQLIPTQIWIDAGGKEIFRHEGVMPAGDIVAKFKELGIDLGAPVAGSATPAPAAESAPTTGGKETCCP